jgi:hypothetical protein
MHKRIATLVLLNFALVTIARAQAPATNGPATNVNSRPGVSGWHSPSAAGSPTNQPPSGVAYGSSKQPTASPHAQPQASTPRPNRAQVTEGTGKLPTDHGQIWREYDISPYTLRIQSTKHPEQAVVDWILRETGYETWHSTPVALLSADTHTLRVYHTPQMQTVVADIVDRFVNTQSDNHGFGLRIVTIHNPNWRIRAMPLMEPISVQSPGVQGWLLAKEDAALLLTKMKQRTDYREHSAPNQMAGNGQSLVISSMRPRTYIQGVAHTTTTWPGYQLEQGHLNEGFSLEFTPLLSLDTRTVDGVVKLRLSQVEKMIPVRLDVPSTLARNQQAQVEVPQMTMLQIHERFRWPADQVLLLSLGVVATPGPTKTNPWTAALPLPKSAPRADALLFIESRGNNNQTAASPGTVGPTASRPQQTFHGRY